MEVSFDKQGKVRVLGEEKYEQTKQLQEQTAAFSSSKCGVRVPQSMILVRGACPTVDLGNKQSPLPPSLSDAARRQACRSMVYIWLHLPEKSP